MAGGPILQFWETALANPVLKDLKVRFAIAMVGNIVAVVFILYFLKRFVPDLPIDIG
ncbi:hypothetical protein [Prochlorococcus sp. MIT 1307]|uniref:hypothetical protein n=1 Tax=Prochlorococcus sp. MIT 1307 TaxID=3096219 RepID=UPI002A760FFF|nr:hypothetical protein [Prochlorococcus sp. MIT 1307]